MMPNETVEETNVSDMDTVEQEAKPRKRLRRALAVGLVVLALIGAGGYLGLRLRAERTLDSARSAALEAGQRYATDLSSYDYRDLGGNFSTVTANSTDKFATQYKQVSGSLTGLIQQYQATSRGSVVGSGIAEADAGHAVLMLFVDQTITNTNNQQPRVDRNRMRLTLVHSGDRWLIDDVQLL